jgi:hypothetical protein
MAAPACTEAQQQKLKQQQLLGRTNMAAAAQFLLDKAYK